MLEQYQWSEEYNYFQQRLNPRRQIVDLQNQTACADRARLCTQSAMSSSKRRMWAKIFVLLGSSGS